MESVVERVIKKQKLIKKSGVEKESPLCPGCGKLAKVDQNTKPYTDADHFVSDGIKRSILRCQICELQFVHPRFEEESLHEFYSNETTTWNDLSPLEEPEDFPASLKRAEKKAEIILEAAKKQGLTQGLRVLELGAGLGELGLALIGLEPNLINKYLALDWDNQFLQRLNQIWPKKSFTNLQTTTQLDGVSDFFDIIVLSDVLQRAQSPQNYLTPILARLRKGGILAIYTPEVDLDKEQEIFPQVLFFNSKSLGFLIQSLGLSVVSDEDPRADSNGGLGKQLEKGIKFLGRKLFHSEETDTLETIYRSLRRGHRSTEICQMAVKY